MRQFIGALFMLIAALIPLGTQYIYETMPLLADHRSWSWRIGYLCSTRHVDSLSDGASSYRKGRKMKRTGFTIIDVLVVVAIITILIAMLIPVLNAARRQAQQHQQEQHLQELTKPDQIPGFRIRVIEYDCDHGTFLIFEHQAYYEFRVLGPFPLQLEQQGR